MGKKRNIDPVKDEEVEQAIEKQIDAFANAEEVKEKPEKILPKEISCMQFCAIKQVGELDQQVALKIFKDEEPWKTIRQWEKLFDEREIPYKR